MKLGTAFITKLKSTTNPSFISCIGALQSTALKSRLYYYLYAVEKIISVEPDF